MTRFLENQWAIFEIYESLPKFSVPKTFNHTDSKHLLKNSLFLFEMYVMQ